MRVAAILHSTSLKGKFDLTVRPGRASLSMPAERSGTMDMRLMNELIDDLPEMTRPRMAELWQEYFGKAPAPKLRVDLMRPILAYRIQERQRQVRLLLG